MLKRHFKQLLSPSDRPILTEKPRQHPCRSVPPYKFLPRLPKPFSFFSRFLIGLALSGLLIGCQINYYWHLFHGQANIFLNSQPLEEVLTNPNLDAQRLDKLLFIEKLRAFASSQIGLDNSTSYTCFFDTKGQPISWNLSASPPERFDPYLWEFPLIGSVPYKGFFDKNRALEEREILQASGMDVLLRPVSAYSTLGFFSDPILSTMLDYPYDRLADLILHELTHGTIYAKGHTDFNESLATFVGQTGSLLFLAELYGPETPLIQQAQTRREDQRRFSDFMAEVVTSLDSLYSLKLTREKILADRKMVFNQAKKRFSAIQTNFKISNYDGFLEWEVNNAHLLSYRRYHRDLENFHLLYNLKQRRLDLMLAALKLCQEAENPWACLKDSISVEANKKE